MQKTFANNIQLYKHIDKVYKDKNECHEFKFDLNPVIIHNKYKQKFKYFQ